MRKALLANGNLITAKQYAERQRRRDSDRAADGEPSEPLKVFCPCCARPVHFVSALQEGGFEKATDKEKTVLRFDHYREGSTDGHGNPIDAKPGCKFYYRNDPRFSGLAENEHRNEIRSGIRSALHDDENARLILADIQRMAGIVPENELRKAIVKATKKAMSKEVLITHPRLFAGMVVHSLGFFPFHFRTGSSASVKYAPAGHKQTWQKIRYKGMDGTDKVELVADQQMRYEDTLRPASYYRFRADKNGVYNLIGSISYAPSAPRVPPSPATAPSAKTPVPAPAPLPSRNQSTAIAPEGLLPFSGTIRIKDVPASTAISRSMVETVPEFTLVAEETAAPKAHRKIQRQRQGKPDSLTFTRPERQRGSKKAAIAAASNPLFS